MKKRVQGKELGKLFVLLIILVAASLVVDLVSLNVLYSIGDDRGLKGELATLSSLAEECIKNECDSWRDCFNMYYEVLNEVFNEVYKDCVKSHTVTEGYYSYISPSDIEDCRDEADDTAVAAASDAYDACRTVSKWCKANCEKLWPEGGDYEDYSSSDPYSSDSSGSSCSGNADCPSTGCLDGRLMRMACISGTCDYGHKIGDC